MSELSDVKHVLETEFTTEFPTTPTLFENVDDGQPDDELWCRVSVTQGGDSQASMGHPSARHRMVGVFVVEVHIPLNLGTKDADDFAGQVVARFRTRTIGAGTAASPHVHFRENPMIKTIGQQGQFWKINVVCPWYSDTDRTAVI